MFTQKAFLLFQLLQVVVCAAIRGAYLNANTLYKRQQSLLINLLCKLLRYIITKEVFKSIQTKLNKLVWSEVETVLVSVMEGEGSVKHINFRF